MKVTCVVLEDGSQYNVGALTPATLGELITELSVIGGDVHAVLMKGKYKSVKKVK